MRNKTVFSNLFSGRSNRDLKGLTNTGSVKLFSRRFMKIRLRCLLLVSCNIFLEMHHLTSEVCFQIGIRIVCRFCSLRFFFFLISNFCSISNRRIRTELRYANVL